MYTAAHAEANLMRTTLAIDDDVLAAAKELAKTENRSVGEVISELARTALRPAPSRHRTRNGVPLLTVRPGGKRVTSQLVRQLQEELS
jgi:Ribbon-helix-helix protein, copG family